MGDVAPREFDFTLDVGDHERDEQNVAVAQSGASLFPELVWAHFRWQQDVQRKSGVDGELETAYRGKLEQFEACEGDIVSAYWSTYRASAIALTEKRRASALLGLPLERSTKPSRWFATEATSCIATRSAGPRSTWLMRIASVSQR